MKPERPTSSPSQVSPLPSRESEMSSLLPRRSMMKAIDSEGRERQDPFRAELDTRIPHRHCHYYQWLSSPIQI